MLRRLEHILVWALSPRRLLALVTAAVAVSAAAMQDARIDGWWIPPASLAMLIATLLWLARGDGDPRGGPGT